MTLILRYSVACAPYGKMQASIRETFFFERSESPRTGHHDALKVVAFNLLIAFIFVDPKAFSIFKDDKKMISLDKKRVVFYVRTML